MKQTLRKELLQARGVLPVWEVKRYSQLITERVLSLTEFQRASTIMLYLDFKNEVQTSEIIQQGLAKGKKMVVPITDTKNVRLIPSELKNYPDDLVQGTWGILEPKPEYVRPIDPQEIDLVLVPGVGFDRQGNRLGYGGGYYDRFIPSLRPKVKLVALAFELQVRTQVYPESHDQVMDYIVTENEIIICQSEINPKIL